MSPEIFADIIFYYRCNMNIRLTAGKRADNVKNVMYSADYCNVPDSIKRYRKFWAIGIRVVSCRVVSIMGVFPILSSPFLLNFSQLKNISCKFYHIVSSSEAVRIKIPPAKFSDRRTL